MVDFAVSLGQLAVVDNGAADAPMRGDNIIITDTYQYGDARMEKNEWDEELCDSMGRGFQEGTHSRGGATAQRYGRNMRIVG